MKLFRSLLFWLHLALGVVAGAVILVMAVTGVALTYEKQALEWADARAMPLAAPSTTGQLLPPEALLEAAVEARPGAVPSGLARRARPDAPVTVTFEGGTALLVDPARGTPLGAPSPRLRAFFRTMTNWHRWLALEGEGRAAGRSITGAANLAFLGLVVSGSYLWLPRVWSRRQVAQVLWLRRGLTAKARDFNWHNAIGIWSAVPLLVVVAGAVPISFPWASDAVYRLAGEAPPPRAGGPSRGGPTSPRTAPVAPSFAALDAAWAAVEGEAGPWRAITVRLGGDAATYVFTVDQGSAGRPQRRRTVTVNRASAAIVSRETFADLSAGRRLRSWLRFAHTGEYYGLPGQTVAGLASAGGAVLVYTGLALACRRGIAWLRRRSGTRLDVPEAVTRRSPS